MSAGSFASARTGEPTVLIGSGRIPEPADSWARVASRIWLIGSGNRRNLFMMQPDPELSLDVAALGDDSGVVGATSIAGRKFIVDERTLKMLRSRTHVS